MTIRLPLVGQRRTDPALEVAPPTSRAECPRPAIFILHSDGDFAAMNTAAQLSKDVQRLDIRVCLVLADHITLPEPPPSWVHIEPKRLGCWETLLQDEPGLVIGAGHQLPGWLRPTLTLLIAPRINPASWAESTRSVRDRIDVTLTRYRRGFVERLIQQFPHT